jgi:poly(A) polymerase
MAAPQVVLSPDLDGPARRRALYRLGTEAWSDQVLIAWAASRDATDNASWRGLYDEAESWERPRFPVTGRDLKKLGLEEGAEVGDVLRAAEAWWIEGDFRADRQECLVWIADRIG